MRLPRLVDGHRFVEKIKLTVVRVMNGSKPDVLRALLYRPEFWGKPFSVLTHAVMRGPGVWPIGEREIMAAYVSKLNQCVF